MMILKICVDDDCVKYRIDDRHKQDAINILNLIRIRRFKTAGFILYKILKASRLL